MTVRSRRTASTLAASGPERSPESPAREEDEEEEEEGAEEGAVEAEAEAHPCTCSASASASSSKRSKRASGESDAKSAAEPGTSLASASLSFAPLRLPRSLPSAGSAPRPPSASPTRGGASDTYCTNRLLRSSSSSSSSSSTREPSTFNSPSALAATSAPEAPALGATRGFLNPFIFCACFFLEVRTSAKKKREKCTKLVRLALFSHTRIPDCVPGQVSSSFRFFRFSAIFAHAHASVFAGCLSRMSRVLAVRFETTHGGFV